MDTFPLEADDVAFHTAECHTNQKDGIGMAPIPLPVTHPSYLIQGFLTIAIHFHDLELQDEHPSPKPHGHVDAPLVRHLLGRDIEPQRREITVKDRGVIAFILGGLVFPVPVVGDRGEKGMKNIPEVVQVFRFQTAVKPDAVSDLFGGRTREIAKQVFGQAFFDLEIGIDERVKPAASDPCPLFDGQITGEERFRKGNRLTYRLTYPNVEVKSSLTDTVLGYLVQAKSEKERNVLACYDALQALDVVRLREIFHTFFASIPYDWYRKNEFVRYEAYYASVFYCYFTALGLDVTAEQMTNKGRIDMAVRLGNRVFILEFKVVEIDGTGSKAIEQIRKMGYWERYIGKAEEIYLIGVEFSSTDRHIVGFEWCRA